MNLSQDPAALATLKAAILADPALASQPMTADGAFAIAAALNETASPNYFVWHIIVTWESVMQNGFDWTAVDALTDPKARTWEWLFRNAQASCNPSYPGVRAGIAEVWKGTAQKNAVRAYVFGKCQRLASRAEKLFATGLGVTTDADGNGPATMTHEGTLAYQDVETARALP